MRKYFAFILAITLLLLLGTQNSRAESLTATYDLGDNYTLSLGSKAANLPHSRNIIGLKKSDIVTEGDVIVFTLTKPYDDFGGDHASLGVVYTKPLQKNMTGILSLTGGPTEDSLSTQDVALTFHFHIKLQ